MTRFLHIYKNCIKVAFAKASAYRLSFFLSLMIRLGFSVLFPLVTVLIYNSGASFPEWDVFEVLLLQSVFMVSSGLASIMFGGVLWTTLQHIREGSYEIVLLKPMDPLFFLIASNFEPGSFGLVIGGGALFVFSLYHTGLASVSAIPLFLLLFAAGFAVMAGMSMLMAATSFKWVGNSRIPEMFDSIMDFGKYPITIFPQAVRGFATFAIPVGMIGFYPAQVLLGRLDWRTLAAVVPCALFMLAGVWVYHYMIRRYEGVGG
jgi:ABC-2 type transport system permease protein